MIGAESMPEGIPAYRMIIPPGWGELPANRDAVSHLLLRARAVLRAQHRPELEVELRRMAEQTVRKMKQAGTFAIYLQTAAEPEEVVPMSITASVARGQLGGSLDRQVSELFRERGAEFLTDDRSIVRWQLDIPARGTGGVPTRTVNYLIPVPGSERRTAVQFVTTLPLPAGEEAPEALLDAMCLLSDTVVSTFSWEPQAA